MREKEDRKILSEKISAPEILLKKIEKPLGILGIGKDIVSEEVIGKISSMRFSLKWQGGGGKVYALCGVQGLQEGKRTKLDSTARENL